MIVKIKTQVFNEITMENDEDKHSLPHHKQQSLCTTRLPYRQGRNLTAVKAYSITKESNHLLIFGVPSLNLRQETKTLFIKFGKLLQFAIATDHPSEQFTETYHAQFDKIQPARLAKRMLDTKNFYGGSLHICYAPELETLQEARQKLLQRKNDVTFRLRNLEKEFKSSVEEDAAEISQDVGINKLNMGEVNVITMSSRKRKKHDLNKPKKAFKDKDTNNYQNDMKQCNININVQPTGNCSRSDKQIIENKIIESPIESRDIVDCTSVDIETITNVNEHLNYDKFGGEVVRQVNLKPLNKIQFHFNKS